MTLVAVDEDGSEISEQVVVSSGAAAFYVRHQEDERVLPDLEWSLDGGWLFAWLGNALRRREPRFEGAEPVDRKRALIKIAAPSWTPARLTVRAAKKTPPVELEPLSFVVLPGRAPLLALLLWTPGVLAGFYLALIYLGLPSSVWTEAIKVFGASSVGAALIAALAGFTEEMRTTLGKPLLDWRTALAGSAFALLGAALAIHEVTFVANARTDPLTIARTGEAPIVLAPGTSQLLFRRDSFLPLMTAVHPGALCNDVAGCLREDVPDPRFSPRWISLMQVGCWAPVELLGTPREVLESNCAGAAVSYCSNNVEWALDGRKGTAPCDGSKSDPFDQLTVRFPARPIQCADGKTDSASNTCLEMKLKETWAALPRVRFTTRNSSASFRLRGDVPSPSKDTLFTGFAIETLHPPPKPPPRPMASPIVPLPGDADMVIERPNGEKVGALRCDFAAGGYRVFNLGAASQVEELSVRSKGYQSRFAAAPGSQGVAPFLCVRDGSAALQSVRVKLARGFYPEKEWELVLDNPRPEKGVPATAGSQSWWGSAEEPWKVEVVNYAGETQGIVRCTTPKDSTAGMRLTLFSAKASVVVLRDATELKPREAWQSVWTPTREDLDHRNWSFQCVPPGVREMEAILDGQRAVVDLAAQTIRPMEGRTCFVLPSAPGKVLPACPAGWVSAHREAASGYVDLYGDQYASSGCDLAKIRVCKQSSNATTSGKPTAPARSARKAR